MAKIANQSTTTQTMWQDFKFYYFFSLVQDFACLLDESDEKTWIKKEETKSKFLCFQFWSNFCLKNQTSERRSNYFEEETMLEVFMRFLVEFKNISSDFFIIPNSSQCSTIATKPISTFLRKWNHSRLWLLFVWLRHTRQKKIQCQNVKKKLSVQCLYQLTQC